MEKTSSTPVLVLGAGNIGTAMARGIAAAGYPVTLFNRSAQRLKAFADEQNITCTISLDTAMDTGPWLLLLCVETEAVAELLSALAPRLATTPQTVIGSCAAVPTLADMRAALGSEVKGPLLLRVLPNIAATCGAGVNLLAHNGIGDALLEHIHHVLESTGQTFDVPERLFGPAMSLSSCGIAFALRYVRAQTEAAVELGLDPATAAKISAATMGGAAALLADGAHPEALVDRVTTPGGLTIRGLNAMEDAGFSRATMAGVKAAVKHI